MEGREVGGCWEGGQRRGFGGATCSVTGAAGVSGEEMECVDGRSLGSAVPWSGQVLRTSSGSRDEEEEGQTHG